MYCVIRDSSPRTRKYHGAVGVVREPITVHDGCYPVFFFGEPEDEPTYIPVEHVAIATKHDLMSSYAEVLARADKLVNQASHMAALAMIPAGVNTLQYVLDNIANTDEWRTFVTKFVQFRYKYEEDIAET